MKTRTHANHLLGGEGGRGQSAAQETTQHHSTNPLLPLPSHHAHGDRYDAEKKRSAKQVSTARRCFSVLREFFADFVLEDPQELRKTLSRIRIGKDLVTAPKDCLDP